MKLNQLIAVVSGKKSRVQQAVTAAYKMLQSSEAFTGIARRYRPKDEDGEQFPPESRKVPHRVPELIAAARASYSDLIDLVGTLDASNCRATAPIVVDGTALVGDVPVTTLLFLEKQLTDIHSFVAHIPVLDTTEEWTYRDDAECYATKPVETAKTKKIYKPFVKYEATKEHPAQVDIITEDVVVGTWETTKFCGAMPLAEKTAMLERVRKLQDSVKVAREAANSCDAGKFSAAGNLLDYIFG